MSLYAQASSSKHSTSNRISEFDVLKASHKFLREDGETVQTWEDGVAKKYYSSLYREFALCDLKHYKSGNFALRWRSESEVLSGAGEETCGNTRCTFHESSRALPMLPLNTVELPFAYEEHGERKSALVKVVLCGKCLKKLMWKREKEKEERRRQDEKLGRDSGSKALVLSGTSSREEDKPLEASVDADEETVQESNHGSHTKGHKDRGRGRRSHSDEHRRRQKSEGRARNSRSRSPEQRRHSHRHDEGKDRRRSPSRR